MHIPPAVELLWQAEKSREKSRYYPSQSAKSLLKDYFKLNPPTQLVANHPTTSLSVGQVIQFACAVRLEASLAYSSMLEDLLLKPRLGGVGQPVASHLPAERSIFPSLAGSTMGDSAASRSVYS